MKKNNHRGMADTLLTLSTKKIIPLPGLPVFTFQNP